MGKLPWSVEEIERVAPKIRADLKKYELENPDVKLLPPMTVEEATDFFLRYLNTATERPLTTAETLILSQLLSCYKQAVRAETMGKKGRYIVLSEDDINSMMAAYNSDEVTDKSTDTKPTGDTNDA